MESKNETLVVTDYAKDFLKESAKWSKFLAILGFVGIGFMILLAVLMGIFSSFLPQNEIMPFSSPLLSVIYLVFAVIYFFPLYYLYKYAEHTKKAIDTNDSELLQNAFEKLKSHYKFIGIMALIVLSLYALGLLLALFSGIMAVTNM